MATVADHAVDLSAAMVPANVAAADWLAILPVAFPFLAGSALLMLRRRVEWQAGAANFALLVNLAICAGLLLHVRDAGIVTMTMGRWLPPFGISFTVDLMGAVFVTTAAFVAVACGLYSAMDSDSAQRRYGFYTFFLLMMAGVNGAFLTGDVFNLYVWFEVLLIASFGLIVIGSEPRQLDGALKYAFLNLIATTLFLIATGYLYGTFGTLNMADLTRATVDAPRGPIFAIATLYLMAFAMKAAAFPLNFWLPASYHTPRIVVSALFAGLLTKVGVYAMLRISAMLLSGPRDILEPLVATVAAATMLTGVLGAMAQSDLRRLLGYLVIAGIGTMLAGVAIAGQDGYSGAIAYAVHSMIVMAALYLAAGISGRLLATFDLRAMGGLYAAAPGLSVAFLLAAFSVAGLPPLSGFWPKLLLVRGAIDGGQGWLAAVVLVAAALSTIAIVRAWLFAFWRGGPEGTRDGAEAWKVEPLAPAIRFAAFVPVVMLVAATAAIGLFPGPLLELTGAAALGLSDPAPFVESVFGGPQ